MYKLSPSDFRYLYKDCKHCYYQKQGEQLAKLQKGLLEKLNKNNTSENKVKEYEQKIDQLVYKLYGLTLEEIEIVKRRGVDINGG